MFIRTIEIILKLIFKQSVTDCVMYEKCTCNILHPLCNTSQFDISTQWWQDGRVHHIAEKNIEIYYSA